MKKITYILIFNLMNVFNNAQAHVIPDMITTDYNLPKSEHFYIRITPSPVLEGFASYEFCPYIQNHNTNRYLIYNERQKLGVTNYHHNLINPDCQRPYQIDPLSPKVYFDLRDLDRVLDEDDQKKILKDMGTMALGVSVFFATSGAITPVLVGWSVGAAASIVTEDAADVVADHVWPTPLEALDQTQIKYFTGRQAEEGQDMYWPIIPAELETFGECYRSCQADKRQAYESEQNKISDPKYSLRQQIVLQPTESITDQNPLHNFDDCAFKCQGKLPMARKGMRVVWEDLFLMTIYKGGNTVKLRQRPVKDDIMDTDDYDLLMNRYHKGKHLDWSAWTTAVDIHGKLIPNHYTHRGNVARQAIDYTLRYPLCDFIRITSYEKYVKQGGKLPHELWLRDKCSYDDDIQCREFFDSSILTGQEVCLGVE